MFRCSKQFQISTFILAATDDEILQWLKMVTQGLINTNCNRYLANLFLQNRYQATDEMIDKMYNFGVACANSQSTHVQQSHKCNDVKNNNNHSKIQSLPNDIFINIGSYLPVKSSIQISKLNRWFHRMVQNREYFGRQSRLKLTEMELQTICKYDSNLECYEQCEELALCIQNRRTFKPQQRTIDCEKYRNHGHCALQQIVSKIRSNNNSTGNHSFEWFKRLLNNINCLSVANSWCCVFKHIPMSWIFDTDINSSIRSTDTCNNGIYID